MIFRFFLFFSIIVNSQNINVNNDFKYETLRLIKLKDSTKIPFSLNIKPVDVEYLNTGINKFKYVFKTENNKIALKTLGLDYFLEFNSHHPYNRNNGSMIPNRGYQHIISPGIYFKLGPLSLKFKPEHHYSENKTFDGFWDGHYGEVWLKRYRLWNYIDMPERFGEIRHNRLLIGQSNIKLNWKKISLGISNENIWWGPSKRNSIMMSNHAEGFPHISFNTNRPINTFIGEFEWQLISGKLVQSGYFPPRTDYEYQGRRLWRTKTNQNSNAYDWRYLQAFIINYSPKWIENFHLGFIRWAQMYSELVKGEMYWFEGKPTYFPVFKNLFRKNDKYSDFEEQINQAAGFYFKWIWKDSNAEIYAEFHLNDAKQNLRDFILDTDHSRASTLGLQKIFEINDLDFLFNWEWTQMEQTANRLVRNNGTWYEHGYVMDGYTNKGEVLGSSIGPGSNSHYFSFSKINNTSRIGLALEIIDQDNDFYHEAFSSAKDYRRYWKDINLHLKFDKNYKKFIVSSNLIYIRSLNYQWELDDYALPYYHPGRDVDNFHFNLKFTYFGN